MKRPIVVEFSGVPNSGKTTLLKNLKPRFENSNVKAIIMQEAAELLPSIIPKGSIEQNLWITLKTLQNSLEISYKADADFILIDRGFYNQLFWTAMYEEKNAKYSKFVREMMEKFGEIFDVKPDYLFVVDVKISESIRRRKASGVPVTFSKEQFLSNYRKKFAKFAQNIDNLIYIDTTELTEEKVAQIAFETIVKLL